MLVFQRNLKARGFFAVRGNVIILLILFFFIENSSADNNVLLHSEIFISQPDFELDPYLSAPLAGLLTFNTRIPTKIRVEISTTGNSHTLDFEDLKTNHELIITGFYPGTDHTLQITAITQSGANVIYPNQIEVSTDPLPEGFPQIKMTTRDLDKMEPGYTLFDIIPEGNNSEFGALIVIVDNAGKVVWYQIGSRYLDVRTVTDNHLLFIEGNVIVEMDLLGKRIYEWKSVFKPPKPRGLRVVDAFGFHHEVYPMDKGNYLTLSVESREYPDYPTSLKTPTSPTSAANVVGDVIIEFKPDGTTRKKWHLLDMLDPYRVGFDSLDSYWNEMFGKKTRDWSHSNSVIHVPGDNSILVTSRHQDATVKFSRDNGELIWILGPHENWDREKFGKYLLKPINDSDYFFPYHAHAPMVMPNGNLLIYDNGNYRASPFDNQLPAQENFSRAVEYEINESTMEIRLVWEYGQHVSPPVYSSALGDADYLPQTGNVLITHGTVYQNNTNKLSALILEVTHTTPGIEVARLEITDPTSDESNGWRVYRSERIPSLHW